MQPSFRACFPPTRKSPSPRRTLTPRGLHRSGSLMSRLGCAACLASSLPDRIGLRTCVFGHCGRRNSAQQVLSAGSSTKKRAVARHTAGPGTPKATRCALRRLHAEWADALPVLQQQCPEAVERLPSSCAPWRFDAFRASNTAYKAVTDSHAHCERALSFRVPNKAYRTIA